MNLRHKFKVFDMNVPAELYPYIDELERLKTKISFTNGCFDLVHIGHLDFLRRSRQPFSHLIVGLNSDKSIIRLKGPKRPIMNENERIEFLRLTGLVDAVVLFHGESQLETMVRIIRPNFFCKDSSYKRKQVTGRAVCTGQGGRMLYIRRTNISTTNIIERVIQKELG